MATPLGVLILHGMGSQPPDFAEPFLRKALPRLARAGVDPGRIAWKPVHWAGVTQGREDELWADLSRHHQLDFADERKFVINALGDAVAYQRVGGKRRDTYGAIHACLAEALGELERDLGRPGAPLLVIAHSLGCAIASNAIWDAQRHRVGATPFQRYETLCGLLTFGCNLPLFTLSYDKADLQAIAFPPPLLGEHLGEQVARQARWINAYDRDDILGYPLKPINGSYDLNVSEDVEISVGGPLTAWNPLCHGAYWDDGDFVDLAVGLVLRILEALP